MNKIRVLHIIQNLSAGGLERIAAELAAGLDKDRFEAELWCLSGGGPLESLFKNKIPIKTFDYKRYLLPGNILSLAKRVKGGLFDIVHTHSYAPGILGRTAAKIAGVKVIIHHHHSVSASVMNIRHRLCEQFVTNVFTDKVIACSEATREFILREKFAKKDMVVVIHNGVPEEFEKPSGRAEGLKKELGITNERILTSVGSLTHHKGHIYLLMALKDVVKAVPGLKLIIVGAGPEKSALEKFIEENSLQRNVILAGGQSDVRPFLEIADIFVLPSLVESMSISSVEAMSKRLPVIASRTGGVTEVVKDGETGILAEPSDPSDLAKKIKYLLGNDETRKNMGKNGYGRYKEYFTLQKMKTEVQDLYLRCLESKKR